MKTLKVLSFEFQVRRSLILCSLVVCLSLITQNVSFITAFAGTTTTTHELYKPAYGEAGATWWGNINSNFDKIDARLENAVYAKEYTTLDAALAVAELAFKPVIVDKEMVVSSAITVASTSPLVVSPAGRINHGTYNVTVNGPFAAGIHQVFVGTGTVKFGLESTKQARPQWFGAKGDRGKAPGVQTATLSDAGGGKITVTSPVAHGLAAGEYAQIFSTGYDGYYAISNPTGYTFDITAVYAGGDVSGYWMPAGADDTTAIRAAFSSLADYGGEVLVEGRFRITAPVDTYARVTPKGLGTSRASWTAGTMPNSQIHNSNQAGQPAFRVAYAGHNNSWRFSGVMIEGNALSGHGIHITSALWPVAYMAIEGLVENCAIVSNGGSGVYAWDEAYNLRIRDSLILQNGINTIVPQGPTETDTGDYHHGVFCYSDCNAINFSDNNIQNNYGWAVKMWSGAAFSLVGGAVQGTNGGGGLWLRGMQNARIASYFELDAPVDIYLLNPTVGINLSGSIFNSMIDYPDASYGVLIADALYPMEALIIEGSSFHNFSNPIHFQAAGGAYTLISNSRIGPNVYQSINIGRPSRARVTGSVTARNSVIYDDDGTWWMHSTPYYNVATRVVNNYGYVYYQTRLNSSNTYSSANKPRQGIITGIVTNTISTPGDSIKVTSAGHTLTDGEQVWLGGTTSYNSTGYIYEIGSVFRADGVRGYYTVSSATSNTFVLDIAYSTADTTGYWHRKIWGPQGKTARSGSYTAAADAGGGLVRISATSHGNQVGDYVKIDGTAYPGYYEIMAKDTDWFDITATYTATDTGTWTYVIKDGDLYWIYLQDRQIFQRAYGNTMTHGFIGVQSWQASSPNYWRGGYMTLPGGPSPIEEIDWDTGLPFFSMGEIVGNSTEYCKFMVDALYAVHLLQSTSVFTNVKDTAGYINIYYDSGGTNTIHIQNKSGTPRNIRLITYGG
jgi:hypothetical protein